MKIEQAVQESCATCTLVRALGKMTGQEWLDYARHLREEHKLKPYYMQK